MTINDSSVEIGFLRDKLLRISTFLLRLKTLGKADSAEDILSIALEALSKLLNAPHVHLFVPDHVAKAFCLLKGEGLSPADVMAIVIPFSEPNLFSILSDTDKLGQLGGPILSDQLSVDPSFESMLKKLPVPVDLLVPFLSSEQDILGFITIGGLDQTVDKTDLSLIDTVVSLAGSLYCRLSPLRYPSMEKTAQMQQSVELKVIRCGRCKGIVNPREVFCSSCGHQLF